MSIRVAVVGLGGQGRNYASYLQDLPPWEVVGGSDISPASRQIAAEQLGFPVYETVEELLEKTQPEVVYVATATFAHVEPTVTALQAGCHVVLDKPMGVNLAEADVMVAAAQAARGELFIYHNRRGDGDFFVLNELVQAGRLGAIKQLRSCLMADAPEPAATPENWRADPARGGGALLDWGPHLLDQALALVPGTPRRLFAEVRTMSWTLPVENYFRVQVWCEGDGFIDVEYNNAAPLEMPRFYVLGERGAAIKYGMEGCVGSPLSLLHTEFLVRDYLDDKVQIVRSARQDPGLLWRNLAEVVQGKAEPLVPLAHAYKVMKVLDAARRSAESGEIVEL
ncbi:MAG TPA: Gfo/Idh/MocA family oxidoreductase [Armatimonadota bacterium]|jgi:predicted dehydrogenase